MSETLNIRVARISLARRTLGAGGDPLALEVLDLGNPAVGLDEHVGVAGEAKA
jgi:hypothetical protein